MFGNWVLFLNRYEFYFLLLSPKLTLKLKLQLWKVPPRNFIHRESYALLKQSENICSLHVRQVLFLNRYEFYFLLLSPRFWEPSWMDSKTIWFPPPEVLGIADGVGLKEREEEQQLNKWPQQRCFRFRPDRRTRQACLTLYMLRSNSLRSTERKLFCTLNSL